MRRPFVLGFGLILVAAAAAGFEGLLYAESGTNCGSLLRPDVTAFCDPYEQRRRVTLVLLLAVALPLVLVGLVRTGGSERPPRRVRLLPAAAAGLLTLPIASVILFVVALLNYALFGFTQESTGLPYVFAPAALAVGALVSARLAVRAGADSGAALVAAALGLPLAFSVQAVAEAFRWRLDDVATPLLLSGLFSGSTMDAATLVTLALAAIPIPLLLVLAASSSRRVPAGLGVVSLFLSALVGGVLFEADDSVSIRWLPLLLLPAVLTVLAARTRSRPDRPAPVGRAHERASG